MHLQQVRPWTGLLLGLVSGLWTTLLPAADAAHGRQLIDKHCVTCHSKQFGGDGSGIYTRADRKFKDRKALDKQVSACNGAAKAGMTAADEADVAAYLSERYYRFKK